MRFLIVTGSAGYGPWLEIEELAQRPIIEEVIPNDFEAIWVEADSSLDSRFFYRAVNYLIGRQIDFMYRRNFDYRPLLHRVWRTRKWKAIGSLTLEAISRNKKRESRQTGPSRFRLRLPSQRGFWGIRTLALLDFAASHYDFDFLVRLSSTTVPAPNAIRAYCKSLPDKRVFAGVPGDFFGQKFLSGASLIFSRDVVTSVVASSKHFRHNVYEDVGLSKIVEELDLADFYEFSRAEVGALAIDARTHTQQGLAPLAFRCKTATGETKTAGDVVQIMLSLRDHLS